MALTKKVSLTIILFIMQVLNMKTAVLKHLEDVYWELQQLLLSLKMLLITHILLLNKLILTKCIIEMISVKGL